MSSRLTNYQREAFIKAVLADVPSVDYCEEVRKTVQEHMLNLAPAEVQAIYKSHPEYVTTQTFWTGLVCVNAVAPSGAGGRVGRDHYPDLDDKLKPLEEAYAQQGSMRSNLKDQLKSVIYACTTVKKAKELLPEFEEYLPQESAPTTQLPAVSNVVANLMAAGWPKGSTQGDKHET